MNGVVSMSEKTRLATLKELGWGYEEIAESLQI